MTSGEPPEKPTGLPEKDKDKSEIVAKLSAEIRSTPGFGKLRAQWEQHHKGELPPKKEKEILRTAIQKVRPLPVPPPKLPQVRLVDPPERITVSVVEPPLPIARAVRIEVEPIEPEPMEFDGPQPKLPKWQQEKLDRERMDKERGEQNEKLMQELLVDLEELETYEGSSCQLFRADGRSPWQMLDKHNGQFLPQPGAISRTAFFTEVFVTSVSPEDWFANWISGHPKGKPCVSTGPQFDDSQGASNTNWFYGFSVPGGLQRIGPSAATLQFELGLPGAKACAQDGVYLLSDTGHIAGATIIAMSDGPAGEHIWLTGVPNGCVLAYARSTATPWLAQWRPFKPTQVQKYGKILSSKKYAELVNWVQLYDAGK